jgi:hypothetical protein
VRSAFLAVPMEGFTSNFLFPQVKTTRDTPTRLLQSDQQPSNDPYQTPPLLQPSIQTSLSARHNNPSSRSMKDQMMMSRLDIMPDPSKHLYQRSQGYEAMHHPNSDYLSSLPKYPYP